MIFRKELGEIRTSRMLLASILVPPLVVIALLLRDALFAASPALIAAESTLFVSFYGLLLPITISGMLSVDSFAGERNRRTIEPVLASPVTERELFVGKALGAFLPAMAITYGTTLTLIVALGILSPSTLAISLAS